MYFFIQNYEFDLYFFIFYQLTNLLTENIFLEIERKVGEEKSPRVHITNPNFSS